MKQRQPQTGNRHDLATLAALSQVVMIRHAQSEWNLQGRFTGWADPALTDAGRDEAAQAGILLARRRYGFDQVYTSCLGRARETAAIVQQRSDNDGVPVTADWRLNERHYGALQGEAKSVMAARVGDTQVWRWRRGYHDRPPPLSVDGRGHRLADPAWRGMPATRVPNGESLADTRRRVMEFWAEVVIPDIRSGRRLLIASHGNTLRALIMALADMSVAEVEAFEIPTGMPITYTFSHGGEPVGWHYLVDQAPRTVA